jgi:hypothetical protein
MSVTCNYCNKPAKLVSGRVIYPQRADLISLLFWYCKDCKAWVGCHKKTTRPLGKLATQMLRELRAYVHTQFDPLWQNGQMTRTQAYVWLAEQMQMTVEDCHIGMFNEEQCRQVMEIINASATVDN